MNDVPAYGLSSLVIINAAVKSTRATPREHRLSSRALAEQRGKRQHKKEELQVSEN